MLTDGDGFDQWYAAFGAVADNGASLCAYVVHDIITSPTVGAPSPLGLRTFALRKMGQTKCG